MSSSARGKLRVVQTEQGPESAKVDITALLRADIKKRDWRKVHVRGDKGPIAPMAEAVTRHRDGRPMALRVWRLG